MSSTTSAHHIGAKLRDSREKIGLSVRTLATRAGFSPSFISQVENGQASPSIGSLEKIAACLQVSLSELFDTREAPTSVVVRAKQRPRLGSEWSQADIESLRSDASSRFEPLLITLRPGGSSSKSAHAVNREQFVFVVSGVATLTLNDEVQILHQGDAVTLKAQMPALWQNASKRAVQLLFVSLAAV